LFGKDFIIAEVNMFEFRGVLCSASKMRFHVKRGKGALSERSHIKLTTKIETALFQLDINSDIDKP
jgi:hypothetical protein